MPFSASLCLTRPALKLIAVWAALALVLNLIWEIVQLPLYTLWQSASAASLAWAVVHCTLGDGLIAVGSFILALFALQDPDWPASRPWSGGAIAIAYGLSYTAYSEWHNVYQTGAWAYSPAMPLVFGIGLAPLLQWLVVPSLAIVIWRKSNWKKKL